MQSARIEPHGMSLLHLWIRNVSPLAIVFSLAFVAIFASKLVVIAALSGMSPYWDQWDGEAAFLYKPYIEGRLDFWQLVAPHNEHRIFFSRVLSLLLLEARGAWDVKLQMVVNSALLVASLAFLVVLLMRKLPRFARFLLVYFVAVAAVVPFGWSNTLGGFQSPFHFMALFSFLAISFFCSAHAFGRAWWIGVVFALMSFLSSASGGLTFLLLGTVAALQLFAGMRSGPREWLGLALLMGLFAAAVWLTPDIAGHRGLKAKDFGHLVGAVGQAFSWPVPFSWALLFTNLPILAFAGWAWKNRVALTEWHWVVLALAGWSALQMLALAYGRAVDPLASRYLDTILVGLLINAAAGLWLLSARLHGRTSAVVLVVWLVVIAFSLGHQARHAFEGAAKHNLWATKHERAVGSYLRSRDPVHLSVPPRTGPQTVIPYPNSQRLKMLLDDPTINSLLLPPLNPSFSGPAVADKLLLRGSLGPVVSGLKSFLLSVSWGLFLGSFLLMLVVGLCCSSRLRHENGVGAVV